MVWASTPITDAAPIALRPPFVTPAVTYDPEATNIVVAGAADTATNNLPCYCNGFWNIRTFDINFCSFVCKKGYRKSVKSYLSSK